MRLRVIFTAILLTVLVFPSMSQKQQGQRPPFDVEKHHKERADFFIKELNLTAEEQKGFVPLLHDYFHDRYVLSKEVRDAGRQLRRNKARTDKDCQKVIDMVVDTKIKEANLQKEYYTKFRKVLPAEKVLRYHAAEMKFMQTAVKDHRQRGRSKD